MFQILNKNGMHVACRLLAAPAAAVDMGLSAH
jgi:hypothetical protein